MSDSISLKQKDNKNETESLANTEEIFLEIPKTMKHFFPGFKKILRLIPDNRKKNDYALSELIMASISMYLLKEGSRNAFNNDRQEKRFVENYKKLFDVRLPHMDTVDDLFRVLPTERIEQFKVELIRELFNKKALHKYRYLGKYFVVAIDATGVMSFNKKHCEKCLTKEMQSGKKIWFHNVLEAKLVIPNGMAISLVSEWIENDEEEYEKQDCELKAFRRISKKLKKYFPRLPICLVGDSLYPNERFFKICKENKWEYILTLKEGSLKSVWEEVSSLLTITDNNKFKQERTQKEKTIIDKYRWINEIDYRGIKLNWLKTEEITENVKTKELTKQKFVHLSSIKIKENRAAQTSQAGRLRWKIENEGFNTQKNGGYSLEHKYSRVSLQASKNYYQSLQIASMINRLIELSITIKGKIKGNVTIKHL